MWEIGARVCELAILIITQQILLSKRYVTTVIWACRMQVGKEKLKLKSMMLAVSSFSIRTAKTHNWWVITDSSFGILCILQYITCITRYDMWVNESIIMIRGGFEFFFFFRNNYNMLFIPQFELFPP